MRYAHTSYRLRGMPRNMGKIMRGPSVHPTVWWRTVAETEMRRQGLTQDTLAAKVGCDQGTISKLFAGNPSRVANQVADALGIPRPQLMISDTEDAEWFELGVNLRARDPEKYKRIKAHVARIASAVSESSRAEDELGDE